MNFRIEYTQASVELLNLLILYWKYTLRLSLELKPSLDTGLLCEFDRTNPWISQEWAGFKPPGGVAQLGNKDP